MYIHIYWVMSESIYTVVIDQKDTAHRLAFSSQKALENFIIKQSKSKYMTLNYHKNKKMAL